VDAKAFVIAEFVNTQNAITVIDGLVTLDTRFWSFY